MPGNHHQTLFLLPKVAGGNLWVFVFIMIIQSLAMVRNSTKMPRFWLFGTFFGHLRNVDSWSLMWHSMEDLPHHLIEFAMLWEEF